MIAKFINESYTSSNKDDIEKIVTQLFNEYNSNDEILNGYANEYAYEYYGNNYKKYLENLQENEEFLDWLKEKLKDLYIEKEYDLFNDFVKDNKIIIYRALTVSNEWLKKLEYNNKPFGIWWAYDKKSAEPHWGYNKNKPNTVVVKAITNVKNINWPKTIKANIHVYYDEEHEIQLYEGAEFKILEIYLVKDNEYSELALSNNIKNKVFKA